MQTTFPQLLIKQAAERPDAPAMRALSPYDFVYWWYYRGITCVWSKKYPDKQRASK